MKSKIRINFPTQNKRNRFLQDVKSVRDLLINRYQLRHCFKVPEIYIYIYVYLSLILLLLFTFSATKFDIPNIMKKKQMFTVFRSKV